MVYLVFIGYTATDGTIATLAQPSVNTLGVEFVFTRRHTQFVVVLVAGQAYYAAMMEPRQHLLGMNPLPSSFSDSSDSYAILLTL